MDRTVLHLHSAFRIGEVDRRLFGGFLEHMGRAVYEGVYEPGHPRADAAGLRGDVLDALGPLDLSVVRYPGGNFVSGYHWRDGVGPRADRPAVRELAWGTVEPNTFGTDEFIALARRMSWTPMLCVNLGTGTPEEARDWVEYCNGPPGTRNADLRVQNGSVEPYGVPLWCLGNEMDGPWQLGHAPVEDYAVRARKAAQLMKGIDPSVEVVVSGSSHPLLPTFAEWDRKALEIVGDLADYVSLHLYVGNREDDTPDYLAVTNAIDRQIEQIDAVCRAVAAQRKSRRAYLCFDEWNVWYKTFGEIGKRSGASPQTLIEEVYNLEDALVVAGFLHSFLRHADVVRIANLAQIVNVIAPILTRPDGVLIQSIHAAFRMFAARARGAALRPVTLGPGYTGRLHGEVRTVDASATLDAGRLSVFLTNRSIDSEAPVRVELADGSFRAAAGELLTGPDAKAENSWEAPDRIRAVPFPDVRLDGGRAELALPPLSLVALDLDLAGGASGPR